MDAFHFRQTRICINCQRRQLIFDIPSPHSQTLHHPAQLFFQFRHRYNEVRFQTFSPQIIFLIISRTKTCGVCPKPNRRQSFVSNNAKNVNSASKAAGHSPAKSDPLQLFINLLVALANFQSSASHHIYYIINLSNGLWKRFFSTSLCGGVRAAFRKSNSPE
jgi:hypothetical protein